MHVYPDSVLATTGVDSHGEELPVELLQKVCEEYPNGMPIHQHHDLSKPTIGYFKNFKVVPHEQGHALIADIHAYEEIDPNEFGGLSIAAQGLFYEPSKYKLECYLPFPFYNDTNLIDELKKEDGIAIGIYLKKELSGTAIGIIATCIVLLLTPEWERQYNKTIRPKIAVALNLIKNKLWPKKICANLNQKIIVNGLEVSLIFIPDRVQKTSGYELKSIDIGISNTISYIKANNVMTDRIILVYYPSRKKYEITNVRFTDGSDVNIIP